MLETGEAEYDVMRAIDARAAFFLLPQGSAMTRQ
jgi:hypothetical protein